MLAQGFFKVDLGVKITPRFFRITPRSGTSTKYNSFFVGREYTMVELHQGLHLKKACVSCVFVSSC